MEFRMRVLIENPADRTRRKSYSLDCTFACNPNDYGNGYHLGIEGEGFAPQCYDLRYDSEFSPDNAAGYLATWACNYWSGKRGAWALRAVSVVQED